MVRGLGGWREAGRPLSHLDTVDAATFVDALHSGRAKQVSTCGRPGSGGKDTCQVQFTAMCRISPRQYLPIYLAVSRSGSCASGYRAMIAASILQRDGFQPVVLNPGRGSRRVPPPSRESGRIEARSSRSIASGRSLVPRPGNIGLKWRKNGGDVPLRKRGHRVHPSLGGGHQEGLLSARRP